MKKSVRPPWNSSLVLCITAGVSQCTSKEDRRWRRITGYDALHGLFHQFAFGPTADAHSEQ